MQLLRFCRTHRGGGEDEKRIFFSPEERTETAHVLTTRVIYVVDASVVRREYKQNNNNISDFTSDRDRARPTHVGHRGSRATTLCLAGFTFLFVYCIYVYKYIYVFFFIHFSSGARVLVISADVRVRRGLVRTRDEQWPDVNDVSTRLENSS